MQLHLHICQQILTYLLYINISWYLLTNALAFSFNREMPSAVTINIMWNHRLFLCRQSWIIPVSVLIKCDGTGSKLHIKVSEFNLKTDTYRSAVQRWSELHRFVLLVKATCCGGVMVDWVCQQKGFSLRDNMSYCTPHLNTESTNIYRFTASRPAWHH